MRIALFASVALSVGLVAICYCYQYGELMALKHEWRGWVERQQIRVKEQSAFDTQLAALHGSSAIFEASDVNELERSVRNEMASRVKGQWLSSARIEARRVPVEGGLWKISLDIEADSAPPEQVIVDLAALQQKTPEFAIMQIEMQTGTTGQTALGGGIVELHATVSAFGGLKDGKAASK